VKRRIRLSRGIVTLGTDPSPQAQDDRLNHTFFIQCRKGAISVFTLKKKPLCFPNLVGITHPDTFLAAIDVHRPDRDMSLY
jgi:hypothetical protein